MNNSRYLSPLLKVHHCDVCKMLFHWGKDSAVYGSIMLEDMGERQFLTCSQSCRKEAPSDEDLAYIVGHGGAAKSHATGTHWEEWDTKTGRFAK